MFPFDHADRIFLLHLHLSLDLLFLPQQTPIEPLIDTGAVSTHFWRETDQDVKDFPRPPPAQALAPA